MTAGGCSHIRAMRAGARHDSRYWRLTDNPAAGPPGRAACTNAFVRNDVSDARGTDVRDDDGPKRAHDTPDPRRDARTPMRARVPPSQSAARAELARPAEPGRPGRSTKRAAVRGFFHQ